MPESVAQPIEAVNATATGTTEAPEVSRSTSPMERSFEDVVNRLNKKYAGEAPKGEKSLSEIVAKVEAQSKPKAEPEPKGQKVPAAGAKSSAKPTPPAETPPVDDVPPPQEAPRKDKYKVGDQEYELTPEQAKRFTQKGISLEKRVIDIQKGERRIQEWEAQRAQEEEQKQQLLQSLGQNPGEVLERMYGPEIFEKIKPWAAQKVQREMEFEQNPHLAQIEAEKRARAKAEAELQQYRQRQEQQYIAQEAAKLEQSYSKTIMEALSQSGIPRTDFTAAEMAAHIERAAKRKIEYTPQQLAQIVREDNTVRIRALTDGLTSQIAEARKNNDLDTVVKVGEQVVEMFGEPLMYAMAKYHLAKLHKGQPPQPKPVLETPRTQQQDVRKGWGENGRQYMTEDQYREMRQKIARGEMAPPPGW